MYFCSVSSFTDSQSVKSTSFFKKDICKIHLLCAFNDGEIETYHMHIFIYVDLSIWKLN